MKYVLSLQDKVNLTTLSLTPRDMKKILMIPSKRGQIKGGHEGETGQEKPRHPTLDPVLAPGNSLSQYKREIGRDHRPRGHSPIIFPSWSFLLKIQVCPLLASTLLLKEFQSHTGLSI